MQHIHTFTQHAYVDIWQRHVACAYDEDTGLETVDIANTEFLNSYYIHELDMTAGCYCYTQQVTYNIKLQK